MSPELSDRQVFHAILGLCGINWQSWERGCGGRTYAHPETPPLSPWGPWIVRFGESGQMTSLHFGRPHGRLAADVFGLDGLWVRDGEFAATWDELTREAA